ncbi:MAG: ABC transporter substrate-binding protein [Proteobacteria bacterium]|nr:ABC transporter substrate-binding protein [Pseudomonadota bacterium]
MRMARVVLIVLALSAVLGCSKESDTIKIGAVLSVTGPASFLGEPEKNTLLMLQDEINAAGGVEGRKLEIIIYDDETDVNKCVMATKKLIEQDRVVAVFGPSTSGNTLAVVKFFAPAKIPLISCASAEKIVKPVDPWVFNTPSLDRHAAGKILADAKKKGYAKLAILTVSDGFGQAGRGVLQELIPAQGLTLVADEVFGPKDTDMSAQLTKIKGAAPDAIICWGTNPGPAVVARNRVQLGMTTPLYMSHGVASKKFIELAGEAAEGLVLPAGRLLAVGQVPEGHPQKALLTKYVADYTKKFGAAPATFGGHTYDALMLTIGAVKAGKSAKPQDIRDNLEKTKDMAGAGGVYTMSPENHNGLDESAFFMVTIEKGEWKVVD